MIDGVIEGSSPADVIFYCEQDSSAGDYPEGFRQKSDTQPCANRLAPGLARKVKKSPGSDQTAGRFGRIDTRQWALLPQGYP
jgi:hypothetical protein